MWRYPALRRPNVPRNPWRGRYSRLVKGYFDNDDIPGGGSLEKKLVIAGVGDVAHGGKLADGHRMTFQFFHQRLIVGPIEEQLPQLRECPIELCGHCSFRAIHDKTTAPSVMVA